MFYILYKTTNIVNGYIYIGVHTAETLEDKYLGSGVELAKAIIEYGRENFKREILELLDNIDNLYKRENEIVNIDFVKREDTYNKVIGGLKGNLGWEFVNISRKAAFDRGEVEWNSANTVYYNDGIKNFRIKNGQPVPEHLTKGFITKINKSDRSWYNDGVNSYHLIKSDERIKSLKRGRIIDNTNANAAARITLAENSRLKREQYSKNPRLCETCDKPLPYENYVRTCNRKCGILLREKLKREKRIKLQELEKD